MILPLLRQPTADTHDLPQPQPALGALEPEGLPPFEVIFAAQTPPAPPPAEPSAEAKALGEISVEPNAPPQTQPNTAQPPAQITQDSPLDEHTGEITENNPSTPMAAPKMNTKTNARMPQPAPHQPTAPQTPTEPVMTWQHTAMTPTAQPATPEQTAAQQPTPPQATIKHAAPEQMAPKQATPQQTTPQQPLPVPLAQVAAPPARRETTQRTLPERMAPQAPSAPTASITLPMAPMVMQPPALNPAAPAKGDKTLAPLFSDGAPAASQPWHASAWQIGSPPDPLQAPPTDLPAATLRQIAQVLQNQPGRPVELSLNPEELGRLRLSITTTDQGVTVNILAERSETLDLLRRNIDLLGQELRQIGYDSVAFSFGGGQSAPDQDTEGSSNSSAPTPLDTPVEIALEPSAQPARIAAQSGVDIRL